jgi:hypothetical protein
LLPARLSPATRTGAPQFDSRQPSGGSSLHQTSLDTAKSLTEVSAQPSSIDRVAVDEYRIVPDLGTLFAQIEGTPTPKNPQAHWVLTIRGIAARPDRNGQGLNNAQTPAFATSTIVQMKVDIESL